MVSDAVQTEFRAVDPDNVGIAMPAITAISPITIRSSNKVKPRVERIPPEEQYADQGRVQVGNQLNRSLFEGADGYECRREMFRI